MNTLLELGLLEQVNPDAQRFEPRSLSRDDKDALELTLSQVAAVDKQVFRTGSPTDVEAVLAQVSGACRR